ncbi:uncharacterized protein EV422DRAFT_334833 [Fimicolochytrium jonesii]|uniref:uncharacterized protein n=1 Tax=Fimicolochytrium jonesii TaxID=1396493 RepID=UPI0022FE2C5B|nr:uncharacterized protein EV422DRAFT_334833 [Fimicolochytrium jonesii]KAI8816017.1 hypothetical protein EV422DRAFT_334833 [Fimicolochytrium jonesii]
MPRKLPAMTDPAAASLAELAIESPLWTPFLLPTADGTTLSLFIKAHFTSHSYTILVSDFKRCWMETANEAEIARKIKTYAKSFGGTPVEKMVPFIEGYVKEQKESVKYMSVFEPDEAGQLRIHATGQVGSVSFRWVFELSQLHSDAVAPAFTPGDVLFTHLTVPTIIVAAEQERRLKLLQAVIEKKERELQECHESLAFHNVRYAPSECLGPVEQLRKHVPAESMHRML